MSRPRYAVYFAPAPQTPLWTLGSAMIGWDAAAGVAVAPPDGRPCDVADWAELTAEPRRYGFHATLKAPFELADAATEADLLAAARAFAASRRGFVVADPVVRLLSGFVAVVPATPNPDLMRLAADCVVAFEPFRAPLPPDERTRRTAGIADPRIVENVDRWGYPWVFEDFRFHMTLTGRLPEGRRELVRAALAALVEETARPLAVDAIALFHQPRRDGPFRLLERCAFAE